MTGSRRISRPLRWRIEKRSCGGTTSCIGEAQADQQHQSAEQQAQPLAAHLLPGARAELRADHAADHQEHAPARRRPDGWRLACSTVADSMVTSVSIIEVPITVAVGTRSR